MNPKNAHGVSGFDFLRDPYALRLTPSPALVFMRCLGGPKALTSAVTLLATSTNLPASEEEIQEN